MPITNPLTIVQISDCHLYADVEREGYSGIKPYASLQQVLQQVATLNPDCLLVTGDITNDHSAQSYQHLLVLHQQYLADTPMHVIPGNHDDIGLMKSLFNEQQLWFAAPTRFANWHLHLLDSKTDGKPGHVSSQQLADLTAYVQKYAEHYHLVAMHHHPIICGGWMDKYPLLNSDEVMAVMAKLPPVTAMVHGHIHYASSKNAEGVEIMSCPSTCWQWALTQTFAESDERPGFRILRCFDDGQFESEVIRV